MPDFNTHYLSRLNLLSFTILSSPTTNDHEIRVLIDGVDILGKDFLGLDPPIFFNKHNLTEGGYIMIGRCTCGEAGCSSYGVTVVLDQDKVFWKDDSRVNLVFDRLAYETTIEAAKNDHSWEDIKRKVERLATDILKQYQTKDGYIFDWASARIEEYKIMLSYSKNGNQKLLDIAWDGRTEDNVEDAARKFLSENLN